MEPVASAVRKAVAFVRSGSVVSVATRLSMNLSRSGGWRDEFVTLPDDGEWFGRAKAPEVSFG